MIVISFLLLLYFLLLYPNRFVSELLGTCYIFLNLLQYNRTKQLHDHRIIIWTFGIILTFFQNQKIVQKLGDVVDCQWNNYLSIKRQRCDHFMALKIEQNPWRIKSCKTLYDRQTSNCNRHGTLKWWKMWRDFKYLLAFNPTQPGSFPLFPLL